MPDDDFDVDAKINEKMFDSVSTKFCTFLFKVIPDNTVNVLAKHDWEESEKTQYIFE